MANDSLRRLVHEHFMDDEEINSYLHNEKFLELDSSSINQYEVCFRKGCNTLSMWIDPSEYVLGDFVLMLSRDYKFVSSKTLNTYDVLKALHSKNLVQVVFNFDKFNELFRVYFLHDNGLFGYDVNAQGEIAKRKYYKVNPLGFVMTEHSTGKVTSAHKKETDYGYELIRDDGQIYYTYLNKKGLPWQY